MRIVLFRHLNGTVSKCPLYVVHLYTITFSQLDCVGFARIYAYLGDKDQAIRWLEASYEMCEFLLTFLSVWPALDPLRDDPRFQDLLRRMNWEP